MEIEQILTIEDPEERERLWQFYDEIFRPVNEETPIAQSFPEKAFQGFLANPRVTKFVAKDGDEITGLGLITDQLELEPLLSQAYFVRHYPEMPIRCIMAIAVQPDRRGQDLAVQLLRAMINEVPANGWGIFLHSRGVNPFIPRLAEKAGAGHIEGKELDTEAFCAYWWKGGQKVVL